MSTPSDTHSISDQLDDVKQRDEIAIAKLWDHYYPALVKLAEKRLAALGVQQRAFNGEDVAASALVSFFRAVQLNRFPALDSEVELFRLLRSRTLRKVYDRKRRSQTLKAGGGKVRGESAFGSRSPSESPSVPGPGIDAMQSETPSPEWIAMMAEECDGLLAMLQDAELQTIAYLRLEGYSNLEIATKIGKSVSTVERRLSEIRACWKSSLEDENQDKHNE